MPAQTDRHLMDRRQALTAAATGLLGLTVAGCTAAAGAVSISHSGSGSTSGGGAGAPSGSSSSATPAALVISPADQAKGIKPTQAITVTASTGTVTKVTVTDSKGRKIAGKLAGGTWTSSQRTAPATTYTVKVLATGPDGTQTTTRSTFFTLKPQTIATYSMPYVGGTFGVGMPATIQFDSEVTSPKFRAAVERAVSVETSNQTKGAWGWLDNRQLMWRPKSYWKPGTKVTIKANLTGIQTGDSKWVANDMTGHFTIGDAMITHVNIATHEMTVTRNGKTLRTIPISCGRDQMPYITRSGTKVIMQKLPTTIMDSAASGIPKGQPGYYHEKVDWDLRITWTGEFIHSAPWSVYAQGNSNVSHGCINVGPANAIWMYHESRVGDVVRCTGSNREFLPTEGIGVWQYSFADWQRQSALA